MWLDTIIEYSMKENMNKLPVDAWFSEMTEKIYVNFSKIKKILINSWFLAKDSEICFISIIFQFHTEKSLWKDFKIAIFQQLSSNKRRRNTQFHQYTNEIINQTKLLKKCYTTHKIVLFSLIINTNHKQRYEFTFSKLSVDDAIYGLEINFPNREILDNSSWLYWRWSWFIFKDIHTKSKTNIRMESPVCIWTSLFCTNSHK